MWPLTSKTNQNHRWVHGDADLRLVRVWWVCLVHCSGYLAFPCCLCGFLPAGSPPPLTPSTWPNYPHVFHRCLIVSSSSLSHLNSLLLPSCASSFLECWSGVCDLSSEEEHDSCSGVQVKLDPNWTLSASGQLWPWSWRANTNFENKTWKPWNVWKLRLNVK